MPAPIRAKRGACSYTRTSKPTRRSVAAAVIPPIPAPTMAIESFFLLTWISYVLAILEFVTPHPESRSSSEGRASARPQRDVLEAALAAEANIGCGIGALWFEIIPDNHFVWVS